MLANALKYSRILTSYFEKFWRKILYGQPHIPITVSTCYNASGVRCSNSPWQPVDFRMARIVHFVCKSLQEWVENKCVRGTADRDMNCFNATYKNRFWGYNEKTKEMLKWLKDNGYDWI